MLKKPEMFIEAECGRGKKLIIQILIFIAVFMVSSMLQSILPSIYLIIELVKSLAGYEGTMDEVAIEELMGTLMAVQSDRAYLLITLFVTVFGIAVPVIFCRFIEKRPLTSMGFKKKHAVKDYLIGLLIGFAMFSAVILINILTKSMTFEGLNKNLTGAGIAFVLVFFVGFVIQGASEEIIVRGYFMTSMGAKHNIWLALMISSVVFALLHVGNPGFTFIAFVNIVLIGVLFGLYIICFDNIWGACALHSMWNFVQGNFYGVPVSGMNMSDSIFVTSVNEDMMLINGGSFGAEGGLATTIIQLLCIGGLLLYMKKTGRFVSKNKAEVQV